VIIGDLQAVIWDFNGTLLNDLDLVVLCVNRQLAKRGHESISPEVYREVFGFPVKGYYERIGFTFENETMAELSADFFAEYEPALETCSLHEGIAEVLDLLEERGVAQFVLSAMEERMLRATLLHLGIADRFVAAYGLEHQEGDSKVSRGRELVEDYALDPSTTLLIGDTDHDAEVADALGVHVILVASGHQSGTRLIETGRATCADPLDLLARIGRLLGHS
jgi:phosphoglycolate phosphatase